jgi:hypothetical protein
MTECTLLQRMKEQQEQLSKCQHDLQTLRTTHDETVRKLQSDHAIQLSEIDEKIRKMMKTKNEEIAKYKKELHVQNKKYQEIEDVLNDLNDKIQVK